HCNEHLAEARPVLRQNGEIVAAEGEDVHGSHCSNGRVPLPGFHQRHLPEVLALMEMRDGLDDAVGSIACNLDLSVRDDVEEIAGLTLLDDQIPGLVVRPT